MAKESTQKKLDRVRAPRVQIKYEVETGDAIQMKELPFVLAVTSDLSGKPEEPLPKLKDRKFVQIDRDNFDDVLKGMKPRLTFQTDNKLQNDNTKLGVELRFKSLEDFEPQNVARQVEPLRKLMEIRAQLSALLAKADGNDLLADKLREIVGNTELAQRISKEAQSSGDPGKKPDGGAS